MNRKQRRAEKKQKQDRGARNEGGPVSLEGGAAQSEASLGVQDLLSEARRRHQAGGLADAELLYKQILQISPRHPDALHLLGVLANQVGRMDIAIDLISAAIGINGNEASYHCNFGNALLGTGRLSDAIAAYETAIRLKPDFAEAYSNLGNVLTDLGRFDDAVAAYGVAIRIKPNSAETHSNLGNALKGLGRPDDAIAAYEAAIRLKPDFVLGLASLAVLYKERGGLASAVRFSLESIRINETIEGKRAFVECIKGIVWRSDDDKIRSAVIRALIEPWGRPSEITKSASTLVKLDKEILESIARATKASLICRSEADSLEISEIMKFSTNQLLRALLLSAPISDLELERLLTLARRTLLRYAIESPNECIENQEILSFCCALAQQCFINEYIFSYNEDEFAQAREIRDLLVSALASNTPIPALWPAIVASYFPLNTVSFAPRLTEIRWPDEIVALLDQQIHEPEQERLLKESIPRITKIEDDVSILVQSQYEESPYPRWMTLAEEEKAIPANIVFRRLFPLVNLTLTMNFDKIDILIAGCGTGQHSIGSAARFPTARILAVDLSLASLSYAKRKTEEIGISTIEYARGDLLELGSLGSRFDIVESSGVLHHLENPLAGWRVLLSLLRPGGLMKVGFYSEVARRNIIRARKFIDERGYGSTPNEIRRCRQDLMNQDISEEFGTILESTDYFSMSGCRDLLFHVQEQSMTLRGIEVFLHENDLKFLGFEGQNLVLRSYRNRFPDDVSATNLRYWEIFENENPDIFFGMYQFWVQKPA